MFEQLSLRPAEAFGPASVLSKKSQQNRATVRLLEISVTRRNI